MISVVASSVLMLAWRTRRRRNPRRRLVAALTSSRRLETAIADAIARAEPPSWRSIAPREKTHRKRWPSAGENARGQPARAVAPLRLRRWTDCRGSPSLIQPDLVRFRVGRGDRRPRQILTMYHVVKGRTRADRSRGRPAGIRGGDHRGRPAERPGRHRAGRRRRRRVPQAQTDRDRRRRQAPEGGVSDRAGQLVQRRTRRQAVGKLGHPVEHRAKARLSDIDDIDHARSSCGSSITRRSCSSTPSSIWA